MECGQFCPSQPFLVLTVDQFVGHGGGPLERQKQDNHVYRKTAFILLLRKKFTGNHLRDGENNLPLGEV